MKQPSDDFFQRPCVCSMPAGSYVVVRGGPVPPVDFCWSKACFCNGKSSVCHTSVEYHSVLVSKVILDGVLLDGTIACDGARLGYMDQLRFWNQDEPCAEEGNRLLGAPPTLSDEAVHKKRHLLPFICRRLDLNTAHWIGGGGKICHALVIRVDGYDNPEINRTLEEVCGELTAVGFLRSRITSTIFQDCRNANTV